MQTLTLTLGVTLILTVTLVNFLSFVFVISAVHLAFHFKVDCFLSQVLMNLIVFAYYLARNNLLFEGTKCKVCNQQLGIYCERCLPDKKCKRQKS